MEIYRNEQWKLFVKDNYDDDKERLFISTHGRVRKEIGEDEYKMSTIGTINNFSTFPYPKKGTKKKFNYYVHKAVAEAFLEKQQDDRFVIHKNHDLKDNHVDNLQWVNQKELTKHQLTNPLRIAKFGIKPMAKLNEAKVRIIKKKLLDPNRKTRLKIIAKQFGISTMQLHRIKTGQNWSEVEV